MTPPSVPFAVWIWAAFDPVLVVTAVFLGWKADQAGKVFVAVIAALGITLLVDWVLGAMGVPTFAPVSQGGPMLVPVRSGAALVWASLAFLVARSRRRSP